MHKINFLGIDKFSKRSLELKLFKTYILCLIFVKKLISARIRDNANVRHLLKTHDMIRSTYVHTTILARPLLHIICDIGRGNKTSCGHRKIITSIRLL